MNEFLKYLKMIPVIIYPYIYVLIPITSPSGYIKGPPLLPGFIVSAMIILLSAFQVFF